MGAPAATSERADVEWTPLFGVRGTSLETTNIPTTDACPEVRKHESTEEPRTSIAEVGATILRATLPS